MQRFHYWVSPFCWTVIAATILAWIDSAWGAAAPVLAVGRTIVPRLDTQAATNQARFCARLCQGLPEINFESKSYQNPQTPSITLKYRWFKPKCGPGQVYPLVISLHGGGANRNFEGLLRCSSPFFAFGPARLVAPEEQKFHPSFVLVPWSGGRGWDEENLGTIAALINALAKEFPIDARKIYVTGQSMGGYGTWQMICRYPDLFAAAIPVCGGGSPSSAAKAKSVPVWAFHGSADGLVPVSETRNMIESLVKAGGKPAYWEYDGATHAVTAERAYCETALLDWLFSQSKLVSTDRPR
jgi:predicted peptidase